MLIVFNPTAGSRRRSRLDRALALLPGALLVETTGPGHAKGLARAAAARGEDCVVAAGGDGTIAEVAAGLATTGSGTVLGILPLGTANVLALELGLPARPEDAAGILLAGRDTWLWPGIARFADGEARLFVQMLGAGFDAQVVRRVEPALKRRFGRAAYVWQTLRQLPRYRFPGILARLDGADPLPASALVVSKGHFYAGPYTLAPGASPLRPGFHVALIGGGAARATLAAALLPLGLLPRLPGLALRQASRVDLQGIDVPAQMDGDFAGMLPVRVEDAVGPLRIRLKP
jgi:diacylglycerol kinase family enzyme